MAKLYNLARMTTATTGTGTITLGAAVSGYLTFAAAGIANGDVIDYAITEGANSEHGTGTYTSSGTTLTRTVTKSTNGNAAISLSGTAEVFISPRAETLNDASLFSTGTLADARLSGNVALRNAANTYTGGNTFVGGAALKQNWGASTNPATGPASANCYFLSDDGGPAAGAFHRAGAYAVNFGIDSSNYFFIGGWSDGNNRRIQIGANGDTVIRGTLTTGGAMTSSSGNIAAVSGDLASYRAGAPGQGLVFLGNSGSRYLIYDGASYSLAGAHVYSAAGRLLGTTTDTYLVTNGRLVYAADYSHTFSSGLAEPYAGAAITGLSGISGISGPITARYRYMQLQNLPGGWFTVGYA